VVCKLRHRRHVGWHWQRILLVCNANIIQHGENRFVLWIPWEWFHNTYIGTPCIVVYPYLLILLWDKIACEKWTFFQVVQIDKCLTMLDSFLRGFKAHFHLRKFPSTERFPKISLLKVEHFRRKFVSANHILQNFLSAEHFPEWIQIGLYSRQTKATMLDNICWMKI
jgi:hypothetical protein